MKRILSALLLAFVLVSCTPAKAEVKEPLSLTWSIASWHHDRDKDYNENNNGLFLNYKTDDAIFTVARYRNSFDRMSWFAGVGPRWGNFSIAVGAVTGYEGEDIHKPTLTLVPRYEVGPVDLLIIPGVVYGVGIQLAEW